MAYKSVANLAIGVTANSAPVTKGFSEMNKSAKSFGGSLSSVGSSVGTSLAGIGAAIAGVVGVSALVSKAISGVSEAFGRIDEQATTARNLGMTTQAFQGLTLAAQRSNMDTAQLTTSLTKMQDSIGDAASGTGPAVDSFNRLGLSAKDLSNMSPDIALQKISDAMQTVGSATERNVIATDIFGEKNAAMIALLMQGSASMQQSATDAQNMGLALTEIDNSKVVNMNDMFDELMATFDGIYNQIAVAIAPIISQVIADFLEWANSGTNVGDFIKSAMYIAAKAIAYAADTVRYFQIGWQLFKIGFKGILDFVLIGVEKIIEGVSYLWELMGGDKIETPEFITYWREGLEEGIQSDIDTMNELMGKSYADNVDKYFAEAETNATKAAEKIVEENKKLIESTQPTDLSWKEKKEKEKVTKVEKEQEAKWEATELQKKVQFAVGIEKFGTSTKNEAKQTNNYLKQILDTLRVANKQSGFAFFGV